MYHILNAFQRAAVLINELIDDNAFDENAYSRIIYGMIERFNLDKNEAKKLEQMLDDKYSGFFEIE